MCGRMCHWGPLIALGIVKWVTLSTVYCNKMWWPPESGWGGLANMIGFLALSCLTTYHFFCAMCDGPGYLAKNWKPSKESDEKFLQFCEACQGYKAPRAHHCRKCNRCVMKMDHHCPWLNNCVGHFNHGHFVGFLFFAVLGCAQASVTQAMSLYYGLNRSYYHHYGTGNEPIISLTIFTLLTTLFGLGLSIGVVLAVGALLFFQLKSIWRNQTGIEDWILEKADYRLRKTDKNFDNPYFLGVRNNLMYVLRPGCNAIGNGIDWPLREGASKYDMTIEQIYQKQDKKERMRQYKIIKPYSGSWFPLWSQGFRVACRPPCTDEPRIPLQENDRVNVTRWKKHWLYGDKVIEKSNPIPGDEHKKAATSKANKEAKKDEISGHKEVTSGHRVRGWFPRSCALSEEIHFAPKPSKQSGADKKRQ